MVKVMIALEKLTIIEKIVTLNMSFNLLKVKNIGSFFALRFNPSASVDDDDDIKMNCSKWIRMIDEWRMCKNGNMNDWMD